MRTLQSKGRLLVMVKQRRLPFRAVVTPGARRHPSFRKLEAMDICVACLAFRRRYLEISVNQCGF